MKSAVALSMIVILSAVSVSNGMPLNRNYPPQGGHKTKSVSRAAKQACQGDVHRICADHASNHRQIVSCLRGHMAQISLSCRRSLAAE
jgi:hypothetical protein